MLRKLLFSSRLLTPVADQIIAPRLFLCIILDFASGPGKFDRGGELPGFIDDHGDGDSHDREKTLDTVAINPIDPPSGKVLFSIAHHGLEGIIGL